MLAAVYGCFDKYTEGASSDGNLPAAKVAELQEKDQPGQEGDQNSANEPGADAESQDLSDALSMLSQKRQSLGRNPPDAKATPSKPGPKGLSKGENRQGEGEEAPSQGGDNRSQGEGAGEQSQPGKTPMKDVPGAATDIEGAKTDESLQVQVPVTEGDQMQMLMRALPSAKGSTVPDREQLLRYQRTAESALAQEDVPVELRQYVREYFISIGMMGK